MTREDHLCWRKGCIKIMLRVLMVLLCLVLLTRKSWVKILHGFWTKSSFFCKKMGLSIEGREKELLSFLASLEANRMKGDLVVEEAMGKDVVGDSLVPDGANH